VTPKRIRYEVRDDGSAPAAGDTLSSTRSHYLVLDCRAIRTRDGVRRFSLLVVRVDPPVRPRRRR